MSNHTVYSEFFMFLFFPECLAVRYFPACMATLKEVLSVFQSKILRDEIMNDNPVRDKLNEITKHNTCS